MDDFSHSSLAVDVSSSRGTSDCEPAGIMPSAPVLFLIFNRPELTRQSFERIRAARPRQLFVAGDGPRPNVPGEADKVAAARRAVEVVDWPCDVQTLYRENNLGCARAVSSAIDWAFENVDELIVLEDDCLPAASFFPFCTELLERYRDDERVCVISGDNFQPGPPRTPYSYYFSRFNHCWGWATWKRAWHHFDFDMPLWGEICRGGWLVDLLHNPLAVRYWKRIFDQVSGGEIDSWAYRWTFAIWTFGGLTILPEVNLVQNIGLSGDATHRSDEKHSRPASDLKFPLTHPPFVIRDARADSWTQQYHFGYGKVGLLDRIRYRLCYLAHPVIAPGRTAEREPARDRREVTVTGPGAAT